MFLRPFVQDTLNGNIHCKFIFVNVLNDWCRIHSSCDTTTSTNGNSITFAKRGISFNCSHYSWKNLVLYYCYYGSDISLFCISQFQQWIASGVHGVPGEAAAKLAMKGSRQKHELKQLKKPMEEYHVQDLHLKQNPAYQPIV